MKSIFSLLIFLIFSNYYTGHSTKTKIKNYGNVKTLYISEFNFGEKTVSAEELKMEILGRLSKQIADKLGFKDTVMLERKTYLYPDKTSLFILEKNDTNYKLLKLDEGYKKMQGGSGVAIRIQSQKVSVEDVLKMVEYAIKNRKKLHGKLIKTDYWLSETDKIQILANSQEFISEITKVKSNLVDEIINEQIPLSDNPTMKIFWKNNEFVFGMNLDKLKSGNDYADLMKSQFRFCDFEYYINSQDSYFFLIFHNAKTFSYFDGNEDNTTQKITIEKKSWYPFRLGKEKIGTKIILYDTPEYFYVYNINKKLLQKIE